MERCPNCGSPLQGPFCFQCGQQDKDIRRFFLALLNEVFEDLFSPGGRTAKTLFALLFQPGHLTRDYSAGRRARYVPPIRLYLITSFMFFLFLSMSNAIDNPVKLENTLEIGANDAEGEFSKVITFDDLNLGESPPIAGESAGDLADTPVAEKGADANREDDTIEQDIDEAADQFEMSLLSTETNEKARDLIKSQGGKLSKLAKEDPAELLAMLLDLIPPILFVLLPLFAALLKLIYIGSGRYYSEHLVLSLHTHSFVFFILLVRRLIAFAEGLPYAGVVAEWMVIGINVWIPLYLYLTLRTYYGQGTAITALKFLLLGLCHVTLFIMILPLAMVWGFMTL